MVVYMGQSTKHRECLYYYYYYLPQWLKKRLKHWEHQYNLTWQQPNLPSNTPAAPLTQPQLSVHYHPGNTEDLKDYIGAF